MVRLLIVIWCSGRIHCKSSRIHFFRQAFDRPSFSSGIPAFKSDDHWNLSTVQFVQSGAIVLKFWMQIDKEEQRKRFEERQKNPEKQWKITEEDWRNRDKWDAYEEAVNEMLIRTSTPEAPWVIVEGNCKYYARIKVLEAVIEAIEKRLESR